MASSIFPNVSAGPIALSVVLALTAGPGAQSRSVSSAQSAFERGLVALHHFEYEDAHEAFARARAADIRFVMAYWGEAMTYYQPLWRRENVAAGRAALARLAPTPAERAARAADDRERGYIEAVDLLFGDGDSARRHARYADAMARLHARFPDDPDIACFDALARLSGASRGLIGMMDVHDQHDRQLAGSNVQTIIGEELHRVLASHPAHPGALHYLLHNYDDPEHAQLALDAARAYARVANGASHALHMPSHIFLQLGLWQDAAASDRAAFDASDARAKRRGDGAAARNYHALTWLQYELLQLGRYRDAEQTISEIEPVVREAERVGQRSPGSPGEHQPLLSDLSSMRARYVIEARRWDLLAREQQFGNVDELLAIGLSAARSGNAALADRARQALAERARVEQEGDLRPSIAVMEREVAGQLALAAGRRDEAVAILQDAARAELALPLPLGVPSPAKPAPELLGEVLLELGRPRDARAAFEQTLARRANRSLSLLGAARAAAALGDGDAARQRYRELLTNYVGADSSLSEVAEARAAIAHTDSSPPSPAASTAPLWIVTGGVGAAVLIAVVVLRRRTTPRVQTRPRGTRKK